MEEFSAAPMVTFCVDPASLMTPFGYFNLMNQNCILKTNKIFRSVRGVRKILWEELTTLKDMLTTCGNKVKY